MIPKNNSYFSPELIEGGHYIVTGLLDENYVNDLYQPVDVNQILHTELKNSDLTWSYITITSTVCIAMIKEADISSSTQTTSPRKKGGLREPLRAVLSVRPAADVGKRLRQTVKICIVLRDWDWTLLGNR